MILIFADEGEDLAQGYAKPSARLFQSVPSSALRRAEARITRELFPAEQSAECDFDFRGVTSETWSRANNVTPHAWPSASSK